MLVLCSFSARAQEKKKSGFQEVYTGTIVTMNGPMRSTSFNLSIKDFTSDQDTQKYLGILAEGDQDDLLKVIRDLEIGPAVNHAHCRSITDRGPQDTAPGWPHTHRGGI